MARGRKRKSGERCPSGKLVQKPAIDKGTPEVQSRRKYEAGQGDPALTWCLLGILRANGQISEPEYQSGCDYRKLFAVVYRKPEISAAGGSQESTTGLDELTLARLKSNMRSLDEAVNRVVRDNGRRAKDVFENIVLYARRPNWMRPTFPHPSDVQEAALFKLVLAEITIACGRSEKTRAA